MIIEVYKSNSLTQGKMVNESKNGSKFQQPLGKRVIIELYKSNSLTQGNMVNESKNGCRILLVNAFHEHLLNHHNSFFFR